MGGWDEECQVCFCVDNVDNGGPAILEKAALVDVCRSAEPQPGFKNRDACQARVPRAGSNDLKYPAIAEIGILVRVDPQQLYCFDHDLLLQPASGAVGSVLSSRDRKSVGEGKGVSVSVDLGGRRFNKKKK